MKYRKKPVVIEAVRFTENWRYKDAKQWPEVVVSPVLEPTERNPSGVYGQIETLEGVMTCIPGDWIIRGVNGEVYPCKPGIFEKTYEKVVGPYGTPCREPRP